MASAALEERLLKAPEHLGLETRKEFRAAANQLLDSLRQGVGRLVIDLSRTRSVDSTGLGALVLIRRRAAGRQLAIRLCGLNQELRVLLVTTKLEHFFEIDDGSPVDPADDSR